MRYNEREVGVLHLRENRKRFWSSSRNYYAVLVRDPALSTLVPLLLTDSEVLRAIRRANRNPEDVATLQAKP